MDVPEYVTSVSKLNEILNCNCIVDIKRIITESC